MQLEEEELREVTGYSVACARKVLSVFEASHPRDTRPREAIAEAEAFAAGKRRTAVLRTSAWAALAAAREADEDSPAAHAAYAASHAAASAFLHPIASPHQVKHILGAAVHQVLAVERGALKDRDVGGEPLREAVSLANSTIRDVLRRFPPLHRGRGRFRELLVALDAALREGREESLS